MIEWEADNLTVVESLLTTSLCASVVNPQINIPEIVQLPVRSVNITANGISALFIIENVDNSLCSNTENEDYTPISEDLSFMVITGNRQCINISVVDDTVLENDEAFLIEAINTSLVVPIQPFVQVTILNDDCK